MQPGHSLLAPLERLAAPARRRPRLTALLIGAASATGFEPLSLWTVALICFAILLGLIESAPDRRSAFLRGWLFGLGHFTIGLNWIAHAFTFQDAMPHWFGYPSVALLSLYLAVYPGLAALATWWTARRIAAPPAAFVILFAACWLVSEWLRATLFTGFAWNPLGAVALPTGLAIAATLVGTYALGALVALSAGAVRLAFTGHWKPAAALFAPIAAIALWGLLTPPPETPVGAPRIRVVQPNIGQQDKHSPALEEANFRKLAALSGPRRPAPRLIFWPEDAIPAWLDMEPEWRERLASLLGPGDLLMTGGTKVYFKETDKGFYTDRVLAGANNSLFIVTPDARLLGRYDKSHLVPYGEYLPMRSILSPIGLSRLVPGDADFWPGPGPQSMTLPGAPGRPTMLMGGQICYEIIFSGHVVDAANRPAFLFNPSNDAWFGSWGPVQHLAQARLRAIEEGLPIVRSTPTGISAVIDARGHVRAAIAHNRAGYLDTGLPPPLPPTLFARIGNWMVLIVAAALGALAFAIARRASRG
ncbi:apolipoprotein N-acyltransferase [Sphingobium fontiphilum]|uniref:Apolipoprotein N-acyltransferase n=1 Tax=Sphingobium fontiphilum TaxID=944425 RepID=A0A7W6GPY5_9SPHN|nr:apolipoprotein N-acyltransferase [Sphingobium fontiphilum]